MNVVVTIFYSICGAWLLVLATITIVKKVQANKKAKSLKKELENDETREETISESKK